MKLQEIAFMVSLIRANYRRRMLYFWANVLVFVIASIAMHYSSEATSLEVYIWAGSCMILSALRAVIVYIFKPGKFDHDSNLPWVRKKEQMTMLWGCVQAKVDFEEFRDYVPLKEYFSVD